MIREMDSSLLVPLVDVAGIDNLLDDVAVLENKARYLRKVVSGYQSLLDAVEMQIKLLTVSGDESLSKKIKKRYRKEVFAQEKNDADFKRGDRVMVYKSGRSHEKRGPLDFDGVVVGTTRCFVYAVPLTMDRNPIRRGNQLVDKGFLCRGGND